MIYDCCVRQKKCRSILKHVLKRYDNRKSCRRPVVSLSHATKSYRVNRPLDFALKKLSFFEDIVAVSKQIRIHLKKNTTLLSFTDMFRHLPLPSSV